LKVLAGKGRFRSNISRSRGSISLKKGGLGFWKASEANLFVKDDLGVTYVFSRLYFTRISKCDFYNMSAIEVSKTEKLGLNFSILLLDGAEPISVNV
jgi:hypothetical protein